MARGPSHRVATVAALSTIMAHGALARAQTPDTVVEVRGCDAGDALVSAIRVEAAAASSPIAKVTVVCLPESRVLVVAFPPSGGKPAAREIEVGDVSPDARTRSVAIATGELFQGLGAIGVAPAPPPPLPPAPAPIVVNVAPPPQQPIAPPPAPLPPRRGWTVGAALHVRSFPIEGTALVGPAAEVDLRLGSAPVRMRLATDLAFASDHTPAGDVAITTWTGSVAFTMHAASGTLAFDAGPYGEGGGAFVGGSARTGDVTEGRGSKPTALVGAVAIASATFDAVVPYLALDAGAALAGVQATVDDTVALAVTGPFVGARLGLAIAP